MTLTQIILMQANLAKVPLAYIPNEGLRNKLAAIIEMNAALATAFCDAVFTYNTNLKSKVLNRL